MSGLFASPGGPPDTSSMCSLKVDNLTYRTTNEELLPIFEKYGRVGDIYIPRDPHTRDSRGFAFVRFYHKSDAEDAMEHVDGKVVDGRRLRVSMARYGRPDIGYRRPGGRMRGRSRYDDRRYRDDYRRRSHSRDRYRSRSRSPPRRRHRYYSPDEHYQSRSPVRRHSRSASPRRQYYSRSPSPYGHGGRYSRSPSH